MSFLWTQSSDSRPRVLGCIGISDKTTRQHLHCTTDLCDQDALRCFTQHFSGGHLQMLGHVLIEFTEPQAHFIVGGIVRKRRLEVAGNPFVDVRMPHKIAQRGEVRRHFVACRCDVQGQCLEKSKWPRLRNVHSNGPVTRDSGIGHRLQNRWHHRVVSDSNCHIICTVNTVVAGKFLHCRMGLLNRCARDTNDSRVNIQKPIFPDVGVDAAIFVK